MKILILRHGETAWNTEARLQGQKDMELNEHGIRLAQMTAENMKDVHVDICYTSPLKRARKTAELVLKGRNVPILDDARLMEISFGAYEGLCCSKKNPEVPPEFMDAFYNHPMQYEAPKGGETFGQLCDRVKDFIDWLVHQDELQDKTVLLSCHGCSSRALLRVMEGERAPENFWRGCIPPNLSVSTVYYENGVFTLTELDHLYYDRKEWKDTYARR